MVIERKLNNYKWSFNDDTKEMELWFSKSAGDNKVVYADFKMDKIRWFSLFRFMIRVSYRMSTKRRKK